MCSDRGCGYGPHGHRYERCHELFRGFPLAISVEEEMKTLEEHKEDLEDRLNKVNKRLEALKR